MESSSRATVALLLCACASLAASQGVLFPDMGEMLEGRCDEASTGGAGRCLPIRDCPAMVRLVQGGGLPSICGYEGRETIVCCPVDVDRVLGNTSLPVRLTVAPPANLPNCGRRQTVSTPAFFRRKRQIEVPVDYEPDHPGSSFEVAHLPGGIDAETNSWPWMALLGFSNPAPGAQRFFCSAVLLNARWLLTAAHCFKFGDPEVVRMGEHNQNSVLDGETTDYTVARVISYPDYGGSYHDIALVEVTKAIVMRAGVFPICLPWGEEGARNLVGENVTITGWGATVFGGVPFHDILQEGRVTVFPSESCAASYSVLPTYQRDYPQGITSDTFLCAGKTEGGVDTCQGDSGGPLVYDDGPGTPYMLGGIVSEGYGCANKLFPGLYVPVAERRYLQWIKDIAF